MSHEELFKEEEEIRFVHTFATHGTIVIFKYPPGTTLRRIKDMDLLVLSNSSDADTYSLGGRG